MLYLLFLSSLFQCPARSPVISVVAPVLARIIPINLSFGALQEYDKAVDAFADGDSSATAFYLGAMAHYIGDVSQYGHSVTFEQHHGDYESWAKTRTDSFNEGHFESFIVADSLVRRTPYTAVKRVSKATAFGQGNILSASAMDQRYSNKDQVYLDSVGASLNKGVNELADVLHTFFLNIVAEP